MPLNVYTPTAPWQNFAAFYLRVREKEGRVLSDEQLQKLPKFTANAELQKEWRLREKSFLCVLKLLKKEFPAGANVLDVGCGNGWMSHQLALHGFMVTGVDVNLPELEQAARVFVRPNLDFAFADIFAWQPTQRFDVAIFASTLHYFAEPKKVFERFFLANPTLKKIYITDTPFYAEEEKVDAAARTENYYQSHGVPEMAANYHHFSMADLGENARICYAPLPFALRKLIGASPFAIIEVSSTL